MFNHINLVVLVVIIARNVESHGRLLEPPSRSSMFRFAYSDPMLIPHRDIIQPNYLDNQLNCGGRQVNIKQSRIYRGTSNNCVVLIRHKPVTTASAEFAVTPTRLQLRKTKPEENTRWELSQGS